MAHSVLVQPLQLGLGERIEVQHEAHHRGGRRIAHLQLVHTYRVDREQVTMRMVAHGRARAAIARRAKVGADLARAARQDVGLWVARVKRQLRDAGGDIDDPPSPKPPPPGRTRSDTLHPDTLWPSLPPR